MAHRRLRLLRCNRPPRRKDEDIKVDLTSKTDPRIPGILACAREKEHPYYAAVLYTLAKSYGDVELMQEALKLGAANYRREGPVHAWTEKTECECCGADAVLRLDIGYRCAACRDIVRESEPPKQSTFFDLLAA